MAYSRRLENSSPSGSAEALLTAALVSSLAENSFVRQLLKVVFTVMVTELEAVLLLTPVAVTRAV